MLTQKELQHQIASLKEQLIRSENQLQDVTRNFSMKSESLSQAGTELASLRESTSLKHNALQKELDQLKSQLSEAIRESDRFKLSHRVAEDNLRTRTAERDKLGEQLKSTQQELQSVQERLKDQIGQLNGEIKAHGRTIDSLEREKENMAQNLNLVREELQKRVTERDKLQQDLAEQQSYHEQRIGELQAEIKRLTEPPPAPQPPPPLTSQSSEGTIDRGTLQKKKG